MTGESQTFAGRASWQHFYDGEPSFDMLTLEEADRRLVESNDAKVDHMKVNTPTHTKVLASNQPCEDAVVRGLIEAADRTYEVWAILDGHAGWALSWKLRKELIPWLAKHLENSDGSSAGSDRVVASIKEAFVKYDKQIHDEALAALDLVHNKDTNAWFRGWAAMAPASAGSCALVCIHDTKESILYTAVVGDSRAILLRAEDGNTEKSTYSVHALSVDQNGYNADERDRVRSEHPGEEPIGSERPYRTLGIMVTRAFGDHQYKLTQEQVKNMQEKLKGPAPLEKALTPPYLTAQPEVTVTKTQKGDILVMASDGLWDHMSNEGAAECMQEWVKHFGSSAAGNPKSEVPLRTGTPISKPYELDEEGDWKFTSDSIVAEDDNAATSLIRNSAGGNRRELFTAVISAPTPVRRNLIDDISVHVTFF